MFRFPLLAVALLLPSLARASDVQLACTFENLPSFVIYYDSSTSSEHRISVNDRPFVRLTAGSGSNRFESASVDGYSFVFSPKNSFLTVHHDNTLIGTEAGQCVTLGGPRNETPLQLIKEAPPSTVSGSEPETPTQSAPSDTKGIGSWSVVKSESGFDDSSRVVLRQTSTNTISGRFGGTANPSLLVRCQENTTSLFLVAGGHFLSDIQSYGRVDYRVDDRKAGRKSMKTSTDNQALGLWGGGQSIPFIKEIMSGKQLLVRLTPYNESPLEFSFEIDGLDEAIEPLRKACNW
ncbi:type VI secretion protein [Lentibacter algarum]|uniref:type VI secretion system-associated protein TagO n=1 Tax=Lentibacter algarum TaxID=576131 RepID=UPI001C08EA2D|nr:type VI secretion system-associated protein TagO [Lentibacter algarum]MBU2983516.1 type VI secretion protein [Lentibacter algarum]